MDIIIVGAGEIGKYLAMEFSREQHNISVIEQDTLLADELEQMIDAKVVRGDGSKVSSLIEANVESCGLFLALTSDNTVNLVSASMAKAMGVQRVIARVHPKLQREEWIFDYRGHFGIDHTFSSEKLSSLELAKFIRNPNALSVEELANGKIELQQLKVGKKSTMVGKTLREIKVPEKTRVALISRDEQFFVPGAATTIEEGDIVTVFGEPRRLRDFSKRLIRDERETKEMRIAIFGGGEYGFSLAQLLEAWGCQVRVFEEDEERCRFLSEELKKTTIIHADATVMSELQDEQIGEVDFFVATSSSDEDNVMSCLQAHNLGAKKCLTLIHRADYARTISSSGRSLGIRAAISPREATRRDIERYITDDVFHVVKSIGTGQLIELVVSAKATVRGQRLEGVDWPLGCVLVGIVRNTEAWVPTSSDVLQEDDLVYAMVSQDGKRGFMKLFK